MTYLPKTIREVVQGINEKYFLPHIQRELVWKPQQIRKLFDSLMRGYPIGTFLFWKIINNKNKITKLEFIKNFKKHSKNEINNNIEKDEYLLVLDGQQRLQSFFIALMGSYNDKELFLNVLSKNPLEEEGEEDESEIIYETKFFKKKDSDILNTKQDKKTGIEIKKLWVRIKDFGLLDEERIYNYIQNIKKKYENDLSFKESNLLEKNIHKLNRRISTDKNIWYFLEEKEEYDKVLDIFIRTNSGGTKLSKSDLLFSIVKLRWEKIDAYQEFRDLITNINRKGDFEFNNDFILKTSLVLINKSVKYRVENLEKNVKEIEDNWQQIKESIGAVIDLLVNEFNITSKKQLISKNSIIPIINYAFVNNIKTFQSDIKGVYESKKLIKKWLFSVLLTNLFSSQTDDLLRKFREEINKNQGKEFPVNELKNNLPPGKSMALKREGFDKITYGDRSSFFVLSLLYPHKDLNPVSERNKPHVDHIFPEAILKNQYGDDAINNIGNLQILSSTENESKNKAPFEKWIKNLDESFLKKSFIPKNKDLWTLEKYYNFLEERRGILFAKLNEVLFD